MPYKDKEDAKRNNKKWKKANPGYYREYFLKNRDKINKRKREYRKKNHNKILVQEQKWRDRNRDAIRKNSREYEKSETRKKWREDNKEVIKEKKKRRYLLKKEEIKAKRKEYVLKNPQKVKECLRKNYQSHKSDRNEYYKNKKKNNPNFAIRCRLSTNLWTALKKYSKTGKIWKSKTYGVDYEAIIEHLKPFPKDISKYHIDHIKPLCKFDLTDQEEIKKAFAPKNHQWLTAHENLSKGGRF